MGTSNSGCMWWGDIMLVLSMELGTPSRFIHNHFFLFKSVVVLPYFCSILTSFKKELNFKSKDFDLFPSSIQNLKVFCCLWSHHQENREHSKAKTQGHGVGSCRDPAWVWPGQNPPKPKEAFWGSGSCSLSCLERFVHFRSCGGSGRLCPGHRHLFHLAWICERSRVRSY